MAAEHPTGEPIGDRKISRFDDAGLEHQDVADQLAAFVSPILAPSVVALCGARGIQPQHVQASA